MAGFMKVNIEKFLKIKKELDKLNSTPLEEIQFFENGEPIEIDERLLEQWKYIGLNNFDFIITEFYKENPEKSWLQQQLDAASFQVQSWPKYKQEAMAAAVRNKD
jgi:hypothetical protein